MKEILGAELDIAFKELNINAKKTYELKNQSYDYCEIYQVWELCDEDFNNLDSIDEDNWKEEWGWWRYAVSSNMSNSMHRYNIKNHYIYTWDDSSREEGKNPFYNDRKYDNLLRYFHDELSISAEKNICALSADLAKRNNLTMGQLWTKYQG